MRASSLLCSWTLVSTLIGLMPGCTKATLIGTPCTSDSTCTVKGQVCAPGFNGGPSICTHACTGNTGTSGCPIGYDCFPTDATKGSTCNKVLYDVDATGKPALFGYDCALDNGVCGNLGSTNAAPSCRKIPDPTSKDDPPAPADTDPTAYCTGVCATDGDCPLDFACVTDYDTKMKCLRRTLCTSCTVDANCPSDFSICVPTRDGTSRYCTKPCSGTGDCGGKQNSALACETTKNAGGAEVTACLHRFGACLGEGNICDPCFVKADCLKSKSTCIVISATGEGFCSKGCNTDADCSAYGTVKAVCDNTDIGSAANPSGMSQELCNGDVDHVLPGLLSCWVPQ